MNPVATQRLRRANLKTSFQRLNAAFQKEFGRKMQHRVAFEKEFFKRYSTTPQRGAAKDRGSIASHNGTDYYLLPGEKALPSPSVPFNGVEVITKLTDVELRWLAMNSLRFGWSDVVGGRMMNPNLLVYFHELDSYV